MVPADARESMGGAVSTAAYLGSTSAGRAIPIESVLRAREGFDPKDLEPLSLGASRLVLGAANGTP
jgi:hypothetical protein